MSDIQVLLAGKLLNEKQARALSNSIHQSFLDLHYWIHGDYVSARTPDFAPMQETLDHYLRMIEIVHILKPNYFAGCFKTHPAPFDLIDGVATSKFTIEQIVENYNKKVAAAKAAKQTT